MYGTVLISPKLPFITTAKIPSPPGSFSCVQSLTCCSDAFLISLTTYKYFIYSIFCTNLRYEPSIYNAFNPDKMSLTSFQPLLSSSMLAGSSHYASGPAFCAIRLATTRISHSRKITNGIYGRSFSATHHRPCPRYSEEVLTAAREIEKRAALGLSRKRAIEAAAILQSLKNGDNIRVHDCPSQPTTKALTHTEATAEADYHLPKLPHAISRPRQASPTTPENPTNNTKITNEKEDSWDDHVLPYMFVPAIVYGTYLGQSALAMSPMWIVTCWMLRRRALASVHSASATTLAVPTASSASVNAIANSTTPSTSPSPPIPSSLPTPTPTPETGTEPLPPVYRVPLDDKQSEPDGTSIADLALSILGTVGLGFFIVGVAMFFNKAWDYFESLFPGPEPYRPKR